jgi:hypothetical protein
LFYCSQLKTACGLGGALSLDRGGVVEGRGGVTEPPSLLHPSLCSSSPVQGMGGE